MTYLSELNIANFAIIEQVRLRFGGGFNVLTGETGAGKSMIIDAVSGILGGRLGADCIRADAETARIEAVFVDEGQDGAPGYDERLIALLDAYGVEAEDTLVVSREVQRAGRSVCRINGRAFPVSALQKIGQVLVDIHGQTEYLSLLRTAEHLELLDRYGGLLERRRELAACVERLRETRRQVEELVTNERELARRVDLLRFQADEIAAAKLVEGEEEDLAHERRMLDNAERLAQLAEQSCVLLRDGPVGGAAILDQLAEVSSNLLDLARLDPSLAEKAEACQSATYQLEELAHDLTSYREAIEYNPRRLEEVEERLALIAGLKRKYGSTIAEILAFEVEARRELESISHREEALQELHEEERQLVGEVGVLACALSLARHAAGEALAAGVEREVSDLNMAGTRFVVSITRVEDATGVPVLSLESTHAAARPGPDVPRYAFDATGVDRVEFLLAPNPGEPLRPLAKIASGGEMARLMLGLKSVLSAADPVATLIFDEIDVGVGGRSGQVVGQKLWTLAADHQVICVTHLPQTAAYGDHHLNIAKHIEGTRTSVRVSALDQADRVEEIALMLGSDSATARQNATEMLERAEQWKSNRSI